MKAAQSHGADKIHLPFGPSHERIKLKPTHGAGAQHTVCWFTHPLNRYVLMCPRTQTDPNFLLQSTGAQQASFLRQVLPLQDVRSLCKLQARKTTLIIFVTFYL